MEGEPLGRQLRELCDAGRVRALARLLGALDGRAAEALLGDGAVLARLSWRLFRRRRRQRQQQAGDGGGFVFSCGRNAGFLLGFDAGEKALQACPRRVPALPERVLAVAAGAHHSLAVTVSGQVYAWGLNSWGQLGLGDSKSRLLPARVVLGKPVVAVACGDSHSLAMTRDGLLFSWGGNAEGQLGLPGEGVLIPTRVHLPDGTDGRVSSIACGANHSVVTTKKLGSVYTFGSPQNGVLGTGLKVSRRGVPRKVESLGNSFMVQCAASSNISLALSDKGHVFQWGHMSLTPMRVVFPVHKKEEEEDDKTWTVVESMAPSALTDPIVQISCSSEHSAFVSKSGRLFTCGSHADALGHSLKDRAPNSCTAALVDALEHCEIVQASCAKHHTVAIDSLGRMFTWGLGGYGALGRDPVEEFQPHPKLVSGLNRVSYIAAGKEHTIAIMSDTPPDIFDESRLQEICASEEVEREEEEVEESEEEDDSSISSSASTTEQQEKPSSEKRVFPVRSLFSLAEEAVARTVFFANVIDIYNSASFISSERLQAVCKDYILNNLDLLVTFYPGVESIFAEIFEGETEEEEDVAFDLLPNVVEDKLSIEKVSLVKHAASRSQPAVLCEACGVMVTGGQVGMNAHTQKKKHAKAAARQEALSQPVIPIKRPFPRQAESSAPPQQKLGPTIVPLPVGVAVTPKTEEAPVETFKILTFLPRKVEAQTTSGVAKVQLSSLIGHAVKEHARQKEKREPKREETPVARSPERPVSLKQILEEQELLKKLIGASATASAKPPSSRNADHKAWGFLGDPKLLPSVAEVQREQEMRKKQEELDWEISLAVAREADLAELQASNRNGAAPGKKRTARKKQKRPGNAKGKGNVGSLVL